MFDMLLMKDPLPVRQQPRVAAPVQWPAVVVSMYSRSRSWSGHLLDPFLILGDPPVSGRHRQVFSLKNYRTKRFNKKNKIIIHLKILFGPVNLTSIDGLSIFYVPHRQQLSCGTTGRLDLPLTKVLVLFLVFVFS